jgi:hypothetical protein
LSTRDGGLARGACCTCNSEYEFSTADHFLASGHLGITSVHACAPWALRRPLTTLGSPHARS